MNYRDIIRLEHMVKCCDNISAFLKGKRKSQLSHNVMLDSAVRHQLEILGEAANAISKKNSKCASQNSMETNCWIEK